MCYTVYLSTDSSVDLGVHNTALLRFSRCDKYADDPVLALLGFPQQWFVGSSSGCSCSFRHLSAIDLGFGEPLDWYHEEEDHLQATRELYDVIDSLLSSGHKVDCIDTWEGTTPDAIQTLEVSLDEVLPGAFRLFENYRFRFRKQQARPGSSADG